MPWSLNTGEAAGIPLGSVQHPSPSERNQSGQGGQMGPVRQPGLVHCHTLCRQLLNGGSRQSVPGSLISDAAQMKIYME